jgi:hypothetical protein
MFRQYQSGNAVHPSLFSDKTMGRVNFNLESLFSEYTPGGSRMQAVRFVTNHFIVFIFLLQERKDARWVQCNITVPLYFTLVTCSDYSTLNMEAICFSETSVDSQRTTRRCILEYFFCGVGLTSPGTAATSGLLYSPR